MNIVLIVALISLIIRLGVFAVLHLKYRSFDVLKNTVSDYGVGPSRKLYSMTGLLSVIAYAATTIVIWSQHSQPNWLIAVLGIATLSSIAILFFETDQTGSGKTTKTGITHWLFAIVNFTLLFVFMTNAHAPHALGDLFNTVTWIVRVTFYAFLVSLLLPKLRERLIGLTERLFLIAVPLWFIVFCVALLQ